MMFSKHGPSIASRLGFLSILLLCGASAALAGRIVLSPTTVSLNSRNHTDILSLSNPEKAKVRYQVTAFTWTQDESQDQVLEPTNKLVIFPTLLEIAPGEERTLRVGTTETFGDHEASYRIIITELPALLDDGTTMLRVLSRVSIPVFLEPAKKEPNAAVLEPRVSGGRLEFYASNTGNVHLMLQSVQVEGIRSDDAPFAMQMTGWYLLPGTTRRFALDIPHADCIALSELNVQLVTDQGSWSAKAPLTAAQCGS